MSTADLTTPATPLVPAKVQSRQLERLAVIYVRQSTAQQVLEHRESTALQYALRRRAVEWGWPPERVLVIDRDLGRSGATAEGRLGFQQLLAEVGLDHVGLVLGIEMSRLARSCKDWHQLLELCALFGTLLADTDGLYDPRDYNDRLLLGLKGTLSEAELHVLHQRMNQGRLNKARRGELFSHVPIGYVRLAAATATGEVAVDPDQQVQSFVRLVFDKFDELGTLNALLRYLVRHDVRVPVRPIGGADRGELRWRRPNRQTLRNLLHNPLYAGAYTWGRRPVDPRAKVPGRPATGRKVAAAERCQVFLPGRCPAYITWERYEANRRRLADNSARGRGAPRHGPSLLGGVLVCGDCGRRMTVQYRGGRRGRSPPPSTPSGGGRPSGGRASPPAWSAISSAAGARPRRGHRATRSARASGGPTTWRGSWACRTRRCTVGCAAAGSTPGSCPGPAGGGSSGPMPKNWTACGGCAPALGAGTAGLPTGT